VIAFFVVSIIGAYISLVSNRRRRTVPWAMNLPQHEQGYSLPSIAWLIECVYSLPLSYSTCYVARCTVHFTVFCCYACCHHRVTDRACQCQCQCLRTLTAVRMDCCDCHHWHVRLLASCNLKLTHQSRVAQLSFQRWTHVNFRDFRFPPLCIWAVRSSGMLRSVD